MKRQVQVSALVIHSYGLTIKGRSRSHNEDAILWPPLVGCDEDGMRRYLVALADGVGGGPLGEVASATAVAALREGFKDPLAAKLAEELRSLFREANRSVLEMAREKGAEGSATTLLAVLVVADLAWVANVGDSRAYLVRGGRAIQITTDHLLVPRRAKRERVSRLILARAIGTSPAPTTDVFGPIELREHDSLVLCSDGVHQAVDPSAMVDTVSRPQIRRAVTDLCRLAQTKGGDDVSIVVCNLVPASWSVQDATRGGSSP